MPTQIETRLTNLQRQLDALTAGMLTMGWGTPPGTIVGWGAAAAPAGWLLCDGASLLKVSYPGLFAAIGIIWGSVDIDHFNVPGGQGKTLVGVDGAHVLGTSGGTLTHVHADHPALAHAGAGVDAHAGTAVTSHPATATSAASAGAQPLGTTASTLTLQGHLHNTPILAHTVTQPNAHAFTQASDHAAQTHAADSSEQPWFAGNWIIKT